MGKSNLKFGSPEWETHMRRSLAQRKRHGEKINDIDGLITYIKRKGPSEKGLKDGTSSSRQSTHRKSSGSSRSSGSNTSAGKKARSQAPQGPQSKEVNGLFPSPTIVKVR